MHEPDIFVSGGVYRRCGMLPMHVFRLYQKIVTTFDFVIVTTLYTMCILYSHIKITHVSRPKKEVYRRTAMRSNDDKESVYFVFCGGGVGVKAICK